MVPGFGGWLWQRRLFLSACGWVRCWGGPRAPMSPGPCTSGCPPSPPLFLSMSPRPRAPHSSDLPHPCVPLYTAPCPLPSHLPVSPCPLNPQAPAPPGPQVPYIPYIPLSPAPRLPYIPLSLCPQVRRGDQPPHREGKRVRAAEKGEAGGTGDTGGGRRCRGGLTGSCCAPRTWMKPT